MIKQTTVKLTVYDRVTRVFHMLFGLLFIVSFTIGKLVDDDSLIYAYHMLSGILMLFIIVLRLIWGIIGTKYAKFNQFDLNPRHLITYFKQLLSGKTKQVAGHNPASSYATAIMFTLTSGLIATGILMTMGTNQKFGRFGEIPEDFHELLATGFLLIVLFHIAGVMFHQLRHKDKLALSMVTGQKRISVGQSDIATQDLTQKLKSMLGLLVFLSLTSMASYYLINQFDNATGRLTLFGHVLNLTDHDYGHDDHD